MSMNIHLKKKKYIFYKASVLPEICFGFSYAYVEVPMHMREAKKAKSFNNNKRQPGGSCPNVQTSTFVRILTIDKLWK